MCRERKPHLTRSRRIRASFTKQSKLPREHNSEREPMGVEISAGDLLTTHKLKNTDATSHLQYISTNAIYQA